VLRVDRVRAFVVGNDAVDILRGNRRIAACIGRVAQLVERCIQIEKIGTFVERCIQIEEIGAFRGEVGFVCFGVVIVVYFQHRSFMADRSAAVGVLYGDFYGTVSTEVIVVKQE